MTAAAQPADLSEDVVAAIWTLWIARTYTQHGDHATIDAMLTTARETAELIAGFLGDGSQAEHMFTLMQEGIAEALDEAGVTPPGSLYVH